MPSCTTRSESFIFLGLAHLFFFKLSQWSDFSGVAIIKPMIIVSKSKEGSKVRYLGECFTLFDSSNFGLVHSQQALVDNMPQ